MLANKASGFTLIELVIGIVVFSIALVLFTSLIVPQAIRSVDPIFQVRASELGQALMNEIVSKSFDEKSDRTGGATPCDATCIGSINLGPDDGESRTSYNDVDDYHGLNVSNGDIKNSLNETTVLNGSNLYQGFNVKVSVVYDEGMDGTADNVVGNAKLITVTVTTPNDEEIIFASFRSNY
ncbi:prepilin-type N-terminal cleavage/methylation domain-containing protein [Paraglaciecola sp. MB-3u-78]|jgi:MSHA pilin protein MshD|uniref:type IV pilus modification PilV family protein n=1 Tax=Paraglaciecola sp. MB-3u-78 TaxID=2058332 RepID=UPI000C3441C0|nr:type II secretion system protein [Paraglaciecola sp. MB-3u-78]PKG97786.1 prepilin-type cleavage/methylation domain-containing protein [Paraglaciecola sp. MB-3u-78]